MNSVPVRRLMFVGMMKKAFIVSTSRRSRSGIRNMSLEIFWSALIRCSGAPVSSAQALDHVVQPRRLVAADDLGARGPEGELVGGEVLEEGQPDDDHEHRDQADVQVLEEDDGEDDVEQPEQGARDEHPQRESCVATERLPFHRESAFLWRLSVMRSS